MAAADALRVLEEDEVVAVIAVEDFHEVVKPVVGPSDARRMHVPGWHNGRACPFTSRSITSPSIGTIARSGCRRRWCGCVRRRIAEPDPVVLAARHAGHALRQLAAGSAEQLPRAPGVSRPVREFRVEVDLVAEMAVYNPFDFFLEPHAENVPVCVRRLAAAANCSRFSAPISATPRFDAYLRAADRADTARTDRLPGRAEQRLQHDVGYVIRMEPGVQTPEQTLTLARPGRAAIRAGCWCSCCAIWAWPRGSCPAT